VAASVSPPMLARSSLCSRSRRIDRLAILRNGEDQRTAGPPPRVEARNALE
jgi:hypothetical protein